MALYAEEEDVWKCLQHPSKRRRIGVCAACLREKLAVLCSECATARPCACCSSASSSSSSSLSLISFPGDAAFSRSVGGRVSNFIETEPAFRRSRSVAVSIFKSARFLGARSIDRRDSPPSDSVEKRKSWLWLFFRQRRLKRETIPAEEDLNIRTVARSRAVAVAASTEKTSEPRSASSKGWYFPSPMKLFRFSRASAKNVRERSVLHRG